MTPQEDEKVDVRTEELRHCFLCKREGRIVYQDLLDRIRPNCGTWSIRRCPSPDCGLMWLDPLPVEEDLWKLYQTYYTHRSHANDNRSRSPGKTLARLPVKLLISLFNRAIGLTRMRGERCSMFLADRKPGRLLEVGCGNGQMLHTMKDAGWDVTGIEIDEQAGRFAQLAVGTSSVYIGSLEEAALPDDSFDAITMNHVVEHLYDPIAVLRECYRILKPGGRLVLVTPNIQSLGHARFNRNWAGLDPPRHLYLYSPSSLSTLAQQAGFGEVSIWTTPANTYGHSLQSFNILHKRPYMSRSWPAKEQLGASWHQLQALIQYWKHPLSGDELVLMAPK